jgi:hypothetical protein
VGLQQFNLGKQRAPEAQVAAAQCHLVVRPHSLEGPGRLVKALQEVQAHSEAQREGFPQVVVVVQVARESMHR